MIKLKNILSEIENTLYLQISKKEEDEALNFIRKSIIPTVINNWNKNYSKNLNPKIIGRALRKIEQRVLRFSDKKTDLIMYATVDLPKDQQVKFVIYKQVNNNRSFRQIVAYLPDNSSFYYEL